MIDLTAAAGETSFHIHSNTKWEISTPPSWLTVQPQSGEGDASVSVHFPANPSSDQRQATLTLSSDRSGLPQVSIRIIQQATCLSITSFTPHGKGGDMITIEGTGFSDIPANNLVRINNSIAQLLSASSTKLEVKVPMKAGDGKITLTVNGQSITSASNFVYDWTWFVDELVAGSGIQPSGITMDSYGNAFIADATARKIWKITVDNNGNALYDVFAGDGLEGRVDGQGTNARFYYPINITTDEADNIYVLEGIGTLGYVRKITPGGMVSTLTDPSGEPIILPGGQMEDIAAGKNGSLFLTNGSKDKILHISAGGVISDYSSDGSLTLMLNPRGIAMDNTGQIYVNNYGGHSISKIVPSADGTGNATVIAGNMLNFGSSDGDLFTARFYRPADVAVDNQGNLYIADQGNHRIRKITNQSDGNVQVTTIAGSTAGNIDGPASSALFEQPYNIAVNKHGSLIYITQTGRNRKIRRLQLQ